MSYNNFDNNSSNLRDDGMGRTASDQSSGRDQFSSDQFSPNAGDNLGSNDNIATGRGTNTGMSSGGHSNFDNDFSVASNPGGRSGTSDTSGKQGYGAGNDFDNSQPLGRTGGVGTGSGSFADDSGDQRFVTGRHADNFGSTGVDRSGGPGISDKIKGTAETTLGKMTRNSDMVERGQERKTDTSNF